MFKKSGIYIFICLLSLFQYGNTFEHEYVFDDTIVIEQNERVQKGLSNPSEFFRNIKSNEVQHRYGYRPITLLSFAADIEMSEMTPKTGHVMNVLYFALLSCLIFYFLKKMFPEKNTLFSLIVVGLFIVLPVHTEVVANIKSRDEILAMIFGVLSMISFLSFLEKNKNNWIYALLTLVALIASFLSKENGITFIGVIFLIAYIKKSDRINPYLKFALPLFAGAMLIGIRWFVYSDNVFENNATQLLESFQYKEDGFLGNPLHDAKGLAEILPSVFNILIKDIGLLIFPITLVHDYGFSHSTIVGWSNPLVLFSVILNLGLLFVVFREFKKKSILLFGILFYFITLSVYLNIIQVGPDYMAERFLFIPSLGFLLVIPVLVERFSKGSFNIDAEPIWKNKKAKWILACLSIFFVVGFARTINRNQAWESNRTLFDADIVALDDCARTQYNFALLLHDAYYRSPSPTKQEEILYHYQRAVDISCRSMPAMLDLGNAYMEFGQMDKGKKVFESAVKAHPGLAAPLMQLGKFYMSQNDFASALKMYEKTSQKSKFAEVYQAKAICLVKLKRFDEAMRELIKGEKLNPMNADYFVLMSDLQVAVGQKEAAYLSIQKAVKLAPNDANIKGKLTALKPLP